MKPPIVALVIGIDEKDSVVTPGSGVRGGGANFAPLNLFYAFMKMILLGRGRSVPGPPPLLWRLGKPAAQQIFWHYWSWRSCLFKKCSFQVYTNYIINTRSDNRYLRYP